jgi:hypothetical protein
VFFPTKPGVLRRLTLTDRPTVRWVEGKQRQRDAGLGLTIEASQNLVGFLEISHQHQPSAAVGQVRMDFSIGGEPNWNRRPVTIPGITRI